MTIRGPAAHPRDDGPPWGTPGGAAPGPWGGPAPVSSAGSPAGSFSGPHPGALSGQPPGSLGGPPPSSLSGPPPDARILSVAGLRGADDLRAVVAAITAADPNAATWTDGPRGLVAVRSGLSGRALRRAVVRQGFSARVRNERFGAGRVVLRTLGFGVAGLVVGLALGVVFGMGNSMLNPSCTRPGSSGNCAIGVGIFGALGGVLGGPLGLIVGLISGLARRR